MESQNRSHKPKDDNVVIEGIAEEEASGFGEEKSFTYLTPQEDLHSQKPLLSSRGQHSAGAENNPRVFSPPFWKSVVISLLLMIALVLFFIFAVQKTTLRKEDLLSVNVTNSSQVQKGTDPLILTNITDAEPLPHHQCNQSFPARNASSYQQYYLSSAPIYASENEKAFRKHRAIHLSNGLVALLLSDSASDIASAALSVKVGSSSDPEDYLGLAHFCEHVLFMGTQKYPEENDYQKFLASHGGLSNAYTADEETNFHFQVESSAFEPALDRFSRFFIDPLFNENSTEREISAVENEYLKDLESDGWKFYQMVKSAANSSYSFTHFSVGNTETLNPLQKPTREMLVRFYNTYYLPSNMFLVVRASEDLDTLETMVKSKFDVATFATLASDEDRFPSQRPNLSGNPFTEETLQKIYYFEPTKNTNQVGIIWPLPPMKDFSFVRANPIGYISDILEYRGKDGLYDYLVLQQNWVSSISADVDFYSEFTLFYVDMELTEEGTSRAEECIAALFKYLRMIERKGIHQENDLIWKEQITLKQMLFQYPVVPNGFSHVKALSKRLMNSPHYPEYILRPPSIHCLSYKMISDLIDVLVNPSRSFAVIRRVPSSYDPVLEKRSYPTFDGSFDQMDEWFYFRYTVFPMSPEQISMWNHWDLLPVADNKELPTFALPTKNPYLPSDFTLFPTPFSNEKMFLPEYPVLVDFQRSPSGESRVEPEPIFYRNDEKIPVNKAKLWFLFDASFRKPLVDLEIIFSLKNLSNNYFEYFLTKLYATILWQQFQTDISFAFQGGISCDLDVTHTALILRVKGYREKIFAFVISFLKVFKSVATNENKDFNERFFHFKRDTFVNDLRNDLVVDSYRQAFTHLRELIYQKEFSVTHLLLKKLQDLTFEEYLQSSKSLFQYSENPLENNILGIEMFVHGNLKIHSLADFKKDVEAIFLQSNFSSPTNNSAPLPFGYLSPRKVLRLHNVCEAYDLCRGERTEIPEEIYENSTITHQFNNSNPEDVNNAIVVYFQNDDVIDFEGNEAVQNASRHQNMLMQLLAHTLKEPVFNYLRTKESLGYVVFSAEFLCSKTYGIVMAIQGDHLPDYLHSKIVEFLNIFRENYLIKMQEDEFEALVNNFIVTKLRKPG
eukprot:Sdes_comp20939_c0_seq1m18464